MAKRKKGKQHRAEQGGRRHVPAPAAATPTASAPDSAPAPSLRRFGLIALQAAFLIAVGIWIYWPALHGSWLWDDDYLIEQNSIVHDGSGLWYIWFQPVAALIDFFPLTVSLEWLEWQIWPDNPSVFHITSLVFHLADCLLLWVLLRKLGLRLAWLGALLFIVHPVLVESVAWMAELKNTVSLLPFLIALGAWIDFDKKRRREDYAICLVFYIVALLCKSSVITFPAIILLHAWWRRGRIDRLDLLRSVPFFIVSVLDYIGVAMVMKHGVGEQFINLGGGAARLACTGLSLAFYFSKCFLPVRLMPIYPSWNDNPPSLLQLTPWLVMAAVGWWLWERRRGWGRHALFGLGFFVISLLPFCGVARISFMRFSWVMDHMVYVPIIGLIALTVAGLDGIQKLLPPGRRPWLFALVAIVCTAMAISSHRYAKTYQSIITLWTYESRVYPAAWIAHNNLAGALMDVGRYDEALAQVELALAINPLYTEAHNNRGILLARQGRLEEARIEFKKALALTPDYATVQGNLDAVEKRIQALHEAPPAKK